MAAEDCSRLFALLMCSCRQLGLLSLQNFFQSLTSRKWLCTNPVTWSRKELFFVVFVTCTCTHYFHSVHRCLRQTAHHPLQFITMERASLINWLYIMYLLSWCPIFFSHSLEVSPDIRNLWWESLQWWLQVILHLAPAVLKDPASDSLLLLTALWSCARLQISHSSIWWSLKPFPRKIQKIQ